MLNFLKRTLAVAVLTTLTLSSTAQKVYIQSTYPNNDTAGGVVTLYGRGFSNMTSLYFGTLQVAFTVLSDTVATTVTPANGGDYIYAVASDGSNSTVLFNMNYTPAPGSAYVGSVSPKYGRTGDVISIRGSGLTGASSVQIGGNPVASFTVVSDTLITAVVDGQSNGALEVFRADGGYSWSHGDNFVNLDTYTDPYITSFSPAFATTGTTITINGINFTGATKVLLPNGLASSFTVVSPTQVTAVVGSQVNSTQSRITVWTPTEVVYDSIAGPTMYPLAAPVVTGFTPTSDSAGRVVTITGSNFTGTDSVFFGSGPVSDFTVVSPGTILAYVGNDASSGAVKVHNAAGYGSLGGFTYYTLQPTVTSIWNDRQAGSNTIITGTNLTGATAVNFGSIPAPSFHVYSATEITAVIPPGAEDVPITVVTPDGSATSAQNFNLAPTLSGISPEKDSTGAVVTIHGSAFYSVKQVYFGTAPAASFTVVSDTLIRATVGSGASGYVSAYAKYADSTSVQDTAYAQTFFFFPDNGPAIRDFTSPGSDTVGQTVTINGAHFTGTTSVTFGGKPAASFTVVSDSVITAIVGEDTSGLVAVTTPQGTASMAGFRYSGYEPHLYSFYPNGDTAGQVITLVGAHLSNVSIIYFGNAYTFTYTVISDSVIRATVPAGASSGTIGLYIDNGVLYTSIPGFVYGAVPIVNSFNPVSDTAHGAVTLRGYNFTGATALSFGAVPAASFTVVSDSVITAVVPTGVTSHFIGVTTPGGVDSLGGFTYLGAAPPPPPVPVITSFTPASDTLSGTVTLSGKYFTGATKVYFGATASPFFTVVSDSLITAAVFGGTGLVEVVTPNGPGYSTDTFTFIAWPNPVITAFSPGADTAGGTIDIMGSGFTRIGQVYFGGQTASSFTIISDSLIRAKVGSGASGPIIVWSAKQGADTSSGNFTLLPFTKPHITSFTPATDTAGGVVTINGWGFSSTNAVTFDGVPATSFTVVSDSTINAVVGNGATGSLLVFTAHGSDTARGFTFVQPTQHSITSLSPTTDTAGATITISGVGFDGVTGVRFGSQPANFSVTSMTTINAVVPAGTGGGAQVVSVILPGDTLRYDYFTVLDTILPPPAAPQIFSFSPISDTTGGTVTIRGAHLTGTNQVTFGGVPAASVSVVSDSVVTAVVGLGSTGAIWLTATGGKTESDTLTPFTYVQKPVVRPTIASFTPIMDTAGGMVTITGTNLGDAGSVLFGGVPAASFTVVSPTTVTAVLGSGATGILQVGTNEGIAYSVDTFLFVGAKPAFAVTSFTGAMVSNQAQLTWVTRYDQGIAAYNLESSSDSVNFTQIYTVQSRRIAGAGNAYSFIDPNPVQGNNYYRLTAVDTLGNTAGTWQATLNVPIHPQVTTLPNPATGAIYIQVPYSVHTATLTLVDLNGKSVRTMSVPTGAYQVRMDLTGVPGGIYILTWQDGTNRTEKHIMVQ